MQISWFPSSFVPVPGRLGLTSMPGGHSNTREEDIKSLTEKGVTFLVCLVEVEELQRLEPPETLQDRRAAVERGAMSFMHHPIEDFGVPQLNETLETVSQINKALACGEVVVLHCWAGLGRAGTMAACWLISTGMNAQDAIAAVRWVRPGAIQSESQEHHIAHFAQHIATTRS